MQITRLRSSAEIKALILDLNSANTPVALDIETTGLDPRSDKLLSIAITGTENNIAFIFDGAFSKYLLDLTCPLILHNFKFDYTFLFYKGVNVLHFECRDTMLMHHLWDENKPHGLDAIIQEFWKDPYKQDFWAAHKEFQDAPQDEQDAYAGRDVIYTLKLYYRLTEYLKQAEIPNSLVQGVHDFAFALLQTEIKGIKVDLGKIRDKGLEAKIKLLSLDKQMRVAVAEQVAIIEQQMYEKELDKRKTDKGKAGVKKPILSFSSPAQLQDLLYNKCGIPVQYSIKKTPTVDDGALAKLEGYHPVVKLLREHRGVEKVFGSYLKGSLDKAIKGRIYPYFNVNGTVTGRISSSNPNLQQLPAEGGIRGIYVPDHDMVFISADYQQLEITLAAHFSLDANLLRVVNEGASLHDITAEGLAIDRKTAKTINFAVQYGAGVKKIQKILSCSEYEATTALNKYWATYPGLKKLVDTCHSAVDSKEAIANPFGRQRHLYAQNPHNKWEVASIKRQAFNSLIQGTGADITNAAFTRIHEELDKSRQGRGLFVVHDEILIECSSETAVYWNSRLTQVMSEIGREIGLKVPLTAKGSGAMTRWED